MCSFLTANVNTEAPSKLPSFLLRTYSSLQQLRAALDVAASAVPFSASPLLKRAGLAPPAAPLNRHGVPLDAPTAVHSPPRYELADASDKTISLSAISLEQ